MIPQDFSFSKSERIVSQKEIDQLFSDKGSHSLVAFPVRVVYRLTPDSHPSPLTSPVRVLMSVPKKRFKHAVDRNRVKRQLREAYRHHRSLLTDRMAEDLSASVAFIWLTDTHFPSATVDRCVHSLLKRMAAKL